MKFNKLSRTYAFLLCFVAFSKVMAQHDPQFTQYMYNTININPAYAGSSNTFTAFGLYRAQWIGLEGAPTNAALSINSPIKNSKMGVGFSVVNDKIGPTNQSNIALDLSYRINVNSNYQLAVGVKGTASLFSVDYSKVSSFSLNDPLQYNVAYQFNPNIGAGAFLFSDKLYLGFSIPYILQNTYYDDNEVLAKRVSKDRMHYYFIGGYVFDINQSIKFKPAVLSKIVEGAPIQLDVSANFMFQNKFVLGAAYRWSAAVSAMAGFQVSESVFLGYSYDTETTKLVNYNSGSHELFLRYEFRRKAGNVVSPRFF